MCLPQKILQKIILYSSWLLFLVGLLGLVGAIIYSINVSKIDDEVGKDFGTLLAALAYFNSIVIMLFSISGIAGARLKNKCLLSCFNIGNCCCFLDFFALSILLGFASIGIPDENTPCLSPIIDNQYLKASKTLCNYGCECYFSGTITPELSPYILEYSSTDKSKPVRYQDCPQYVKNDDSDRLGETEEQFGCSGWCKRYPIKLFSNVNSKVDHDQSCYRIQLDKERSIYNSLVTATYLITIIFGALMIFTCMLCCHPSKSGSYTDLLDIE